MEKNNSLELLDLPNEILHAILKSMGAALHPSFVGKLEKKMGHSGYRLIEAMYETMYKRIFTSTSRNRDLSAKGSFLNKIKDNMSLLKKHRNIHLTVNKFFAAASDTEKYLSSLKLNKFFFDDPDWEQTLWYAHHINNASKLPKNERIRNTLIRHTADFFSLTKDYPALEKLFEMHKELLWKADTSDYDYIKYNHIEKLENLSFVFYAEHGHLEKVKEILNNNPSKDVCLGAYQRAISPRGNISVAKFLKNHLCNTFKVTEIPLEKNIMSLASENAINGDLEAVKFLIKNYFTDREPIHHDMNLLMFSVAQRGHADIVTFLLKYHAKQEKYNLITQKEFQRIKETAFLYSALQGNIFVIKTLLIDPVFISKISDDFKDNVFKNAALYNRKTGDMARYKKEGYACGEKRIELLKLLNETLEASEKSKKELFLESTEADITGHNFDQRAPKTNIETFQFLFNDLMDTIGTSKPGDTERNKIHTSLLNKAFKSLVLEGDTEKLQILIEKIEFSQKTIIHTYQEATKRGNAKAIQILRVYTDDKIPVEEEKKALEFYDKYNIPELKESIEGPVPTILRSALTKI